MAMQGTVRSVGPLSLFRSLSRTASLLILDMGIFFPRMVVLGFLAPLDASHMLWVG
jgi:hypothetical protein